MSSKAERRNLSRMDQVSSSPSMPQGLIPIDHWGHHYDYPPVGQMRHLCFNRHSNGLAEAFVKLGRRRLVDPVVFWKRVREQGVES